VPLKAYAQAVLGLWVNRRGVTAIEYALIGALIFLVIIVAVRGVGANLPAVFNKVSSEL
jgi:pilus assembly protein Flp/PilA